MKKRAEMGVGTLIVFIAMLLVAAVAAGVLIQTSSSLQERALSTGQQAQGQISTNVQVDEVSATDGSDSKLTDFKQLIKLSPGSDPLKLDETTFTFNTKDTTATLHYRGEGSVCKKNNEDGYNTWQEDSFGEMYVNINEVIATEGKVMGFRADEDISLGMDIDGDGVPDRARTCGIDTENSVCPDKYVDGSYLQFNMSNSGDNKLVYVRMINDDGTVVDLGEDDEFNFTNLQITDQSGNYYGFINGWRSDKSADGYISHEDEDIWFEIFAPKKLDADYDDSGSADYFGFNSTHAQVFLDDAGTFVYPLGGDLSQASEGNPVDFDVEETIENETHTFGELEISGETEQENTIPADATVEVTPNQLHKGYFSAVYEQEGANHEEGILQRGDVVKLCYEAPGEVGEDEEVRLNLMPKIGTTTQTQFNTPDVITSKRVYLYPYN